MIEEFITDLQGFWEKGVDPYEYATDLLAKWSARQEAAVVASDDTSEVIQLHSGMKVSRNLPPEERWEMQTRMETQQSPYTLQKSSFSKTKKEGHAL